MRLDLNWVFLVLCLRVPWNHWALLTLRNLACRRSSTKWFRSKIFSIYINGGFVHSKMLLTNLKNSRSVLLKMSVLLPINFLIIFIRLHGLIIVWSESFPTLIITIQILLLYFTNRLPKSIIFTIKKAAWSTYSFKIVWKL